MIGVWGSGGSWEGAWLPIDYNVDLVSPPFGSTNIISRKGHSKTEGHKRLLPDDCLGWSRRWHASTARLWRWMQATTERQVGELRAPSSLPRIQRRPVIARMPVLLRLHRVYK
jgi:hypothetical protein